MKNQAFQMTGVTVAEYIAWCKEHKLPTYKHSSKQRFFYLIRTNRLCRDNITGKLVQKRIQKK